MREWEWARAWAWPRPRPRLRRPVEPGQCNGSAESNWISSRCSPLCIVLGGVCLFLGCVLIKCVYLLSRGFLFLFLFLFLFPFFTESRKTARESTGAKKTTPGITIYTL